MSAVSSFHIEETKIQLLLSTFSLLTVVGTVCLEVKFSRTLFLICGKHKRLSSFRNNVRLTKCFQTIPIVRILDKMERIVETLRVSTRSVTVSGLTYFSSFILHGVTLVER